MLDLRESYAWMHETPPLLAVESVRVAIPSLCFRAWDDDITRVVPRKCHHCCPLVRDAYKTKESARCCCVVRAELLPTDQHGEVRSICLFSGQHTPHDGGGKHGVDLSALLLQPLEKHIIFSGVGRTFSTSCDTSCCCGRRGIVHSSARKAGK